MILKTQNMKFSPCGGIPRQHPHIWNIFPTDRMYVVKSETRLWSSEEPHSPKNGIEHLG